jgi:hypothetical protein
MFRLRGASAFLGVALTLAACDQARPPSATDDSASPPVATVDVSAGGAFFLPVHHLTELPQAMLLGKLLAHDQCLVAQGEDPRDPSIHLIIWPERARVLSTDGQVTVSLPDGFIRVGSAFSAGGGEYKDRPFIEGLIGRPIPDECVGGTFWLIGELTRR